MRKAAILTLFVLSCLFQFYVFAKSSVVAHGVIADHEQSNISHERDQQENDNLIDVTPLHSIELFTIPSDVNAKENKLQGIQVRMKRVLKDGSIVEHSLNLLEMAPIFGKGATLDLIRSSNKEQNVIMPLVSRSKSYMMKPSKEANEWGSLIIERVDDSDTSNSNSKIKVHGVFTVDNGAQMLQVSHVDHHQRDLNEISFRKLKEAASKSHHTIHEVNMEKLSRNLGGFNDSKSKKPKCGTVNQGDEEALKNLRNNKDKKPTSSSTSAATVDYYKFYPDCYAGDSIPRQFDIGIAVDLGYYKKLGSSTDAVIKDIENVVASARLVYMRQMNIVPAVQNLVITTSSTAAYPLNEDPAGNTCVSDISYVLSKFGDWNAATNDNTVGKERGHWHLFSACWKVGGIVGIAEMNSLCDKRRNVGVTSYISSTQTWLIFAHEMGHGFGATHSFGIGGLMDYNNPLWNGLAQFDSGKRTEMCTEINSVVNSCKHFHPLTSDSSCGNGVIEQGEQCECLKFGFTSCGACTNCKLTSSTIQCSAKDFQMRVTAADMVATFILVSSANLQDSQCCSDAGELYTPLTSCNGGKDVCVNGACKKVCSAYNLSPCTSINSGCTQPCNYFGQCTATLTSQSGVKISYIPDGTTCGKNMQCSSGSCKAVTATTSSPTVRSPTPRPTIKIPTTNSPTMNPLTPAPTSKPTTQSPTSVPVTSTPSKTPTTKLPTTNPTIMQLTRSPTVKPSTSKPVTRSPTIKPTTKAPTLKPASSSPTLKPTTSVPTFKPTTATPTIRFNTLSPTERPATLNPTTHSPTQKGTENTPAPTDQPTAQPTIQPILKPTRTKPPTSMDTNIPTLMPTSRPTDQPSSPTSSPIPNIRPTKKPTGNPVTKSPTTSKPTKTPSTKNPTSNPTIKPTKMPTTPSLVPTRKPKAG